MGSKKTQALNKYLIDLTPHVTVATKDEMAKVKLIEKERACWEGYKGKQLIFLSNKNDYEAIERAEIKDEASSVLASIRTTLEKSILS